MNRLRLRHVTFVGPSRPSASIEFGPRATFVHGPSDTGKSFVVNAIDFVLGASSLKQIPELEGYTTALLGLTLPSGDAITLSRPVNGGRIEVFYDDLRTLPQEPASESLSSKHSAKNTKNVSRFLLSAIGLDQKKIRKNAQNDVEVLSFRRISHLCLINETKMQSEIQPTLSGNVTTRTAEISTFKLLLQGDDDSGIVETLPLRERTKLKSAKTEVIDQLLVDLQREHPDRVPADQVREQLDRLNSHIGNHAESVRELTDNRTREIRNLAKYDRLTTAAQRSIAETDTLEARFQLLQNYYNSDLERLDMVAEAGTLLGYFNPGTCVFCGAEPEHQHYNDQCVDDTTAFAETIHTEQKKTQALKRDLAEAIANIRNQRSMLERRLRKFRARIDETKSQLEIIDADLSPYRDSFDEMLETRSKLEKQLDMLDQIQKLQTLKSQIEDDGGGERIQFAAGIRESSVAVLSSAIAARLGAWGIPDSDRVRYDLQQQDIIAGDQLRSAHGKGVRAILHAAFSIALAQYCFDRDLPHPGFVVLDSPLVTYRPPENGGPDDASDILDPNVADAFYEDIQNNFDGQIIVMENMEPPTELVRTSSDVAFTKNHGHGRFGFFPSYLD